MDLRTASRRLFGPTQLTNAAASVYAPTLIREAKAAVTVIWITNVDTATRLVTVHLVPSGGSAAAANQVIAGLAIPTGTFVLLQDAGAPLLVLNQGDSIYAKADANTAVNLTAMGWEG